MAVSRRRLAPFLLSSVSIHSVINLAASYPAALLPSVPPPASLASSSPSLLPPRAPLHRLAADQVTALAGSEDDGGDAIQLELVSTTERALDVLIFRNVSESPASYARRTRMHEVNMTEDEARDSLASLHGAALRRALGPNLVQFVAVSDRETAGRGTVVGAVDAEFRPGARALTFELPPHMHVANLRVDASARRRGAGTALLSAVIGLATAHPEAAAVTLKVEEWNHDARRLYEREGFVCAKEVYNGFMCKTLEEGAETQ